MQNKKILWITRTAVLLALLIALQWATAGTQVFAGQYITGSCVNAVLAVAVLYAGLWSGASVALLSPFFAKLLGIGPPLIQIIPAIAAGNLIYVLMLHLLGKHLKAFTIPAAAIGKFLTLYLLVVKWIVPMLAANLKPQQITTFSVMFSYPQIITAIIGGILAMGIVSALRKAKR